jgi:hypothetical protein
LEIRVGISRDFINTKKSVFCRVPILVSRAHRNPDQMETVSGVSPVAMTNALAFLETYGVPASEAENEE